MDPVTLLVVIAAVVALVLQGILCLRKENRSFSLGFLNLLLAAVTVYLMFALTSGALVVGTDFGVLLVQGMLASVLLRLSLVVVAILPVLCCYRLCQLNEWKIRTRRTVLLVGLILGGTIGTWAALQVTLINPGDIEPLHVWVYHSFWPPLVVWLTVCSVAAAMALIKSETVVSYIAFPAAAVTAVALFVRYWPTLVDEAGPGWLMLEGGSFTVVLLAVTSAVLHDSKAGRRTWTVSLAIVAAISLLFVFAPTPTWLHVVIGALPTMLFVATLAVVLIMFAREAPPAQTDGGTAATAQAPTSARAAAVLRICESARGRIGRAHALVIALTLPVVAACVVALFAITTIPRVIDFAVMFGLWLILAERLAIDGALDRAVEQVRSLLNGVVRLSPEHNALNALKHNVVAPLKSAATTAVGALTNGSAWWVVAAKGFAATIGVLLLLTAMVEVVSYRQIVVASFAWTGPNDDKANAAVAAAMSDLVVNAIGRLRTDLQPDLISGSRGRFGEHASPKAPLLAAGGDAQQLQSAVGKSEDLKLGGVAVPVAFFVDPVQRIVRAALGVRVVSGSVSKTGDQITVLANMTDGESFREVAVPPANLSPPDAMCGLGQGTQENNTMETLVERLAFRIASTDPAFIAAGLTRNADAFRSFRRGIDRWNSYEVNGNAGDLTTAIQCFREAIRRDPKFAAAYLRLGVAFKRDYQPRSAIEAFHASTVGNPAFVNGALQEALTRWEARGGASTPMPLLAPAPVDDYQRNEAKSIWTRVVMLPGRTISLSERRSAFYGLCEAEYEAQPSGSFLAYFYCSRANALWPWVPDDARDAQETTLQAAILDVLGITLDNHEPVEAIVNVDMFPDSVLAGKFWTCSTEHLQGQDVDASGEVKKVRLSGSSHSRAAQLYYARSLALMPEDVVVQCNLASAEAFTERDGRRMADLSRYVAARINVGYALAASASSEFADDAKRATSMYRRALDEFAAAVGLEGTSIEGLNGYADTAWQWTLSAQKQSGAQHPEPAILATAERYAREAQRLAAVWPTAEGWKPFATGSLGEILLASGRAEEAISVLQPLTDKDWVYANQARWDLAQANLCAATRQQDEKARKLRLDAVKLFDAIRDNEKLRDAKPFSNAGSMLDVAQGATWCMPRPDQVEYTSATYRLVMPRFERALVCQDAEVSASIDDIAPEHPADIRLHVWGDGVDALIPVDATNMVRVKTSTNGDGYHFARLENSAGEPLSASTSIDSFGRQATGCDHSRVRLAFKRVVGQAAAPIARKAPAVPATNVN